MPHVTHIGAHMYAHRMDYPSTRFPLVEAGTTTEIEWPFRTGRGLVARLPFTRKALVVGRWTGRRDEETALMEAIQARSIDYVG